MKYFLIVLSLSACSHQNNVSQTLDIGLLLKDNPECTGLLNIPASEQYAMVIVDKDCKVSWTITRHGALLFKGQWKLNNKNLGEAIWKASKGPKENTEARLVEL